MPKEKKRQKHNISGQYFFHYLTRSLSDTSSYVQIWWHQGSVTGYSLCSTAQPDTDFLLIDPIIGAIIIIPNHKEMDGMLFRKMFFSLSFTRTPENMCFSYSQWYFLYEISNHSAVKVSERKWTQTENHSQWPYWKHRQRRIEPLTAYHANMSGSLGHMLIKWQIIYKPMFSD